MELGGLLLDEEGAFSLSGFQEFTVRPRGGTAGALRGPGPLTGTGVSAR